MASAAVGSMLAASGKLNKFAMPERHLGYLQEMVRKHPESYKEEFMEQFEHYMQTIRLLHLHPSQHRIEAHELLDSIVFLSGVVVFYPKEAKEFGEQIMGVLREQSGGLDPSVRIALCKALLPLRNKNFVDSIELLEMFFELVKLEDKHLRKFILGAVSCQLKRLCTVKKDPRLLGRIQSLCFAKLKDSRSIVVRCSQLILVDAYRKKYLRDNKTANAIADCCFHKLPKIQVASMKFFLGSKQDEEGLEEDSEDEEEEREDGKTIKEIMTAFRHAKKTKKREKDFEKAKKSLNKKKKAKKESRGKECNLAALEALFDPLEFAEKLFKMLETTKVEKFEVRLFRLALIARLIGIHRLQLLSFYTYVQRFLQPKQRDVTRILLYAAQACHEMIPPEIIHQMVRCIAQNFITDRNSPEAMTVGMNAVREIFSNCPFAATEELLRDLAEYKSYKNKNVSMAAKSLVTLFREVNPKLLARKDRGRQNNRDGGPTEDQEFSAYGVPVVAEFVDGAECLEEDKEHEEGEEDDDVQVESDDEETDGEEMEDEEEENEEEDGDEVEESEQSTDEEAGEEEECGSKEEAEGQVKKLKSEKKKDKMQADEEMKAVPKEKATKISGSRILTQEEFAKINKWKIKKLVVGGKRLAREEASRKRTNDEMKLEEQVEQKRARRQGVDSLPRLCDIEHFHKKMRRATKEERMESIMQGREGREEFGKPKKKGSHVGRTNRELAKKKVYQMVKAKVRGKNRQRSLKDQQVSLRKYLIRQSGRKA